MESPTPGIISHTGNLSLNYEMGRLLGPSSAYVYNDARFKLTVSETPSEDPSRLAEGRSKYGQASYARGKHYFCEI